MDELMTRIDNAACHVGVTVVCCLLAVVLFTPNLDAQTKKTVALCASETGGPSAKLAALVCLELEGQLAQAGDRQPIQLDRMLHSLDDFDPAARIEVVKSLLEEAKKSESKRNRKAHLLYREAADGFIALDPWLEARQPLVDALLGVARTAIKTRRDRWRASEAIIQLLNIVPEFSRDQIASKRLKALLAESEAYLLEQPPGELAVNADTPGARVFLNNRLVGISPLLLSDVSPGEHIVTVRKPGYLPTTARVAVTPGESEEVLIKLTPLLRLGLFEQALNGALFATDRTRNAESFKDLRSLLFADQVVGVKLSEKDREIALTGFIYDLRSQQLLSQVTVSVENEGAIAPAARALLASLESGLKPATEEEASSLISSWWFWVSAVAVTAGVVGAVFVLSGEDDRTSEGANQEAPLPPGTGVIRLTF